MRLGADVEDLDGVARALVDGGERLHRVSGDLAALVESAWWVGPSADCFRQDWVAHDRSLRSAASLLERVGGDVRGQSERQRTTSSVGGVAGGGSSTAGGGAGEDFGGSKETPAGDAVHPEAFGADEDHGPFGDDGRGRPELTDIDQGSLGDCWFLTGLGAVARTDPDIIRDNLVDNGDGTYTVTFFERVDGQLVPVEVTVDDTFPVLDDSGNVAYQGVADGDETWAMIYEKAWAEHNGGYDEIVGGSAEDSLEAITGQEFDRYDPNDMTDDELVGALEGDFASAGMINLDTTDSRWNPFDGADTEELARFEALEMQHSHQYVVERVFEQDGQMMVELYNPWGTGSQQPPPMTLDDFRFVSDELDLPAGSAG